MIIYLKPSDPSRPLQSGSIPQDAIVPGTSQEQQQHSKLPKGCFRSLDYHSNTTETHQYPTSPSSSIANLLETLELPYEDFIIYSKEGFLYRKMFVFSPSHCAHLVNFCARI